MITVSDSFKKAIKSDNREIHGYVEVEYQNKSFDTSVTEIPTKSEIVADNGLVQGTKTMQQFATLENNYTLLDGSFMVWNENVILESGYVSNDIFNDISNATITITNNSTNLATKGISIYFKENLPFDFTVTFTDTNNEEIIDNVSNNQSYVYQYFFNTEKNISTVTININRVEFPNNRLRIAYVDFNISDLYEGDELVNFNVTEELDLLLTSIPANTCTINLNNYPDSHGNNKFDIINPKGIASYLKSDTLLKLYIGVLTDTNGVEYVPMGIFYLNDWSSNPDGNVTMNGISATGKLADKSMSSDGSFLADYHSDLSPIFHYMTGFNFDTIIPVSEDRTEFLIINTYLLRQINLLGYIQAIFSSVMYTKFSNEPNHIYKLYNSRKNVITFDRLDTTIVDNITRNLLVNDANVEINPVINNVEISESQGGTFNYKETKDVLTKRYTLKNSEEYFWYELNDYVDYTNATFTYEVISGSGSAEIIDRNYYLLYVKYTGTPGSVIKINYHGNVYTSPDKDTKIYTNNVPEGNKISLNYYDYGIYSWNGLTTNYYLNNNYKYKISAQTMGDPSLEIGDTIAIQTRYKDVNNGYKDIVITKQQFTFDGGLQCSLEGVGD